MQKLEFVLIDSNNDKFKYLDAEMKILHCENGPAVERSLGYRAWYRNGKLHRADGPAVQWSETEKEWYLFDVEHSEEHFNLKLKKNLDFVPIPFYTEVGYNAENKIMKIVTLIKSPEGIVSTVSSDHNLNFNNKDNRGYWDGYHGRDPISNESNYLCDYDQGCADRQA